MKKRYLRRGIIYFLTCNLVLNTWLPAVMAEVVLQPDGVKNGIITVSQLDGGIQDMTATDGAIGHFSNFDIAAGHTVYCDQLGTNPNALFRIFSGDGTQILGRFQANGNIFLIDTAGIFFGVDSQINVNQLVASSLDITNQNFLDGNYEFVAGSADAGAVINNGRIQAAEGVAIIGRKILNTGNIITGTGGLVVMAAGDRVLLGEPGSNIVVEMDSVTIPGDGNGDVINDGDIESPSGTVILAAGDIFSSALEHPKVSSGIGRVEQNGHIHTDGTSGDGGGVSLTAADEVVLAADSLTTANAGTEGDSGLIVAHSKGRTTVHAGAQIEAKGGHVPHNIVDEFDVVETSVEISGNYVNFAGDVDASASDGKRGKVVIDTFNMTIANGSMPDAPPDNTVYEKWIEAQSYASTDVELVAHSKTEGNIIAEPISDGVIEGGSGDIVLRTKYDTGGITFLPTIYGGPVTTAIHTTNGGNVYMLAGAGGITIGDVMTDIISGGALTEPGIIRLYTNNNGHIDTGQLTVNGGSYDEISVLASDYLTINGNVEARTNGFSEEKNNGMSKIHLISVNGDVYIDGTVKAEAYGKKSTTAGILISAGQDVIVNTGASQIEAYAHTTEYNYPADASVSIYAGGVFPRDEGGVATVRVYAKSGTYCDVAEVFSTDPSDDWDETHGDSHALLEIEKNSSGDVPDCPEPPYIKPIFPVLPVAMDDLATTHMGDPIGGNVLTNDDTGLTVSSYTQPGHGTVTVDENGEYIYTPDPGYADNETPDSFTYIATDGELFSKLAAVTITMTNELPVANPSSASEHMGIDIENKPLDYSDVPDQLGYIDKDLTVNIVTGPSYGDVTLQWDETSDAWTYTYVPKDDGEGYFAGTDSFEYTVTDPQGVVGPSGTAQVTINMTNDLPVPTNDNVITDQGKSVGGNVLDNDFDQNKDPLSVVLNGTLPQNGQLELNEDGTFTYVPDMGFVGDDNFTYLVTDSQLGGEPAGATVTITVNPAELPPPTVVMPFISAAPGLERVEFDISGCPALVKWAAAELGIDERTMQIWTVNALASSRDIQPCDACEKLKGVAAILRDDGGTRIAALAQVIGEYAPSTAPPTDEQMASVADAIQRNSQAYNNYTTAGEYVDALVVYVGILSTDLNFSPEEAVMFAVDNYVAPLAENQSVGLAAYIAARLAGLGGS